jgi:hypothetical protein
MMVGQQIGERAARAILVGGEGGQRAEVRVGVQRDHAQLQLRGQQVAQQVGDGRLADAALG